MIGSTFSVPRIEFWDGSTGTRFGQVFSPDSSATSFFGVSLANAGDTTGDGRDEILVGAWGEGDLDTNSGRAYVVDGATLSLFNTIEPAADGGYSHFWEQFGWDVARLPDADGDGRPEYLVGAPGSYVSGDGNGAATAFFCAQQVPADAVVRLGTPPNPEVLSSVTAPKIGATLSLAIDHDSWLPGAVSDFLLISNQVVNVPSAKGTLLVGLGPGSAMITLPVTTRLDLPVPGWCALVGVAISVQVFTTDGGGYSGSNALDLVLGTHAAP